MVLSDQLKNPTRALSMSDASGSQYEGGDISA